MFKPFLFLATLAAAYTSTSSCAQSAPKALAVAQPVTPTKPAAPSNPANLSNSYNWKPVRIGAGGFVTGFVTHPLDARVRYCRTDVGNAYRWNGREWVPMIRRIGKTGLPREFTRAPGQGGSEALAVDPSNTRVVYMAYAGYYSSDQKDAGYAAVPGSVYKSTDGGQTFVAGDLNVPMEPNNEDRTNGERLQVDPNNGQVVYYGSRKNGLWRSVDGGAHWAQVSGGGAPDATSNVMRVLFLKGDTVSSSGQTVGKTVFATTWGGSVFGSTDGGGTWTNISKGEELDGHAGISLVDSRGALYVVQKDTPFVWRYVGGKWEKLITRLTYGGSPARGFAVDPRNPDRLYASNGNGGLGRSLDGGKTWTELGYDIQFANTFGWGPQPRFKVGRSNAGIFFDRDGVLWMPQGNEGVLRVKLTDTEPFDGVRWTIDSSGIEEFVTHDVILPPGGKPLVAVQDAIGLLVNDPATLSAKQISLQDQLISNGSGLAYCPDAPSFVAVAAADVNHTGSGANYSGFSSDGGATWTRFAGLPHNPDGSTVNAPGSIAISRRDGRALGADHLVYLPSGTSGAFYSKDGGATWAKATGFPDAQAYWIFALKQRALKADPFVADKFYYKGSWTPAGLYVSTDGGASWSEQKDAGLPGNTHHGQLEVNRLVKDDLWFVDGMEGATAHGLWHSTDGAHFARVPGVDFAYTLAVGKGSGIKGDAPSATYFYGKMSGDDDWGVFRSLDGGTHWARISYYPTGLLDTPTCMAANYDAFGVVYVGFNGNSFVYGTPVAAKTPAPANLP